jgi:hypothetical protein
MPYKRSLAIGIGLATIYYILFRLISFIPSLHANDKGGAVLLSFSFIFLGPLVAGFLSVYQVGLGKPFSIAQWIFIPWVSIVINILLCLLFAWEGAICIAFILPIALILASIGGVAAGLLNRRIMKCNTATLACLAVIPLLFAPIETKLSQPLQIRTVATEIRIHAPIDVVWHNIERVRPISSAELQYSWANAIGFPRPIEATLSHEGMGGVRNASFERGLNFTETITAWEPDHRIAFTIKADTAAIPSTTLDEHVAIGGRFFDVLNGEYIVEPVLSPQTHQSTGDIILHLASHQRLSTDFNLYAALWSDAVMSDMQNNILHVIQQRCEAEAAVHSNFH